MCEEMYQAQSHRATVVEMGSELTVGSKKEAAAVSNFQFL